MSWLVDPPEQQGEGRWVPSLAATMGLTFQTQYGGADSVILEGGVPPAIPLRGPVSDQDLAVTPFIGVDLQLMAPALPVPSRPRFFLGAEILPTFAASRDLAYEGDPGCIKGPEPTVPCAVDETGTRRLPFGEDTANGQGTRTTAHLNPLSYGLFVGTAFPIDFLGRDVRLKPMAAFISQRVDANGIVIDAACDPTNACTDYTPNTGLPPVPGFLREERVELSRSHRYYSVGPGLDLEMDAGRFGPFGAGIFMGFRAYKVMGDRSFSFGTTETYDDQISPAPNEDVAAAEFEVDVAPWLYRASLGFRVQWLGKEKSE